jgi:hypothetical protein
VFITWSFEMAVAVVAVIFSDLQKNKNGSTLCTVGS